MTQEEFDALEDRTDARGETASEPGGMRSLIAAQPIMRLVVCGLIVAALAGFGAVTLLGKAPRVAVSNVQVVPQAPIREAPIREAAIREASVISEDPDALPPLPSAPAAVAALSPAPIRQIENVEPTQAIILSEDPGDTDRAVAATDCNVVVEQAPLAGAMIAVDILAPCDGGARADIFQGDLQIAYRLDDDGMAQVEIPALSAAATVAVAVEGRTPVSLIARISDIGAYNRAVLFWQGKMELMLHAFEADADFGDEGHVSADAPKSIARTLSGNGGYLMGLGDATLPDAQNALVYTAPAELSVLLSVEVPVTAINCGQEVYAGTIQGGATGAGKVEDLMFTMPDCASIGDYVFLANIMEIPPAAEATTN